MPNIRLLVIAKPEKNTALNTCENITKFLLNSHNYV